MVEQVTCGIKISIQTNFEGTFYRDSKMHYAFGYQISIKNQSKDAVQLDARHWIILDALNHKETVSGEGVVGLKPVLLQGQSHTYNSGCILTSPIGAMKGHYKMINLISTKEFNVVIPTFKLSAPFAIN